MTKPIVYSAPWCPYCVALEQKLTAMNVEFVYKNVDDAGVRAEMNAKTDNNQTIPVLFVGDNYWVNPSVQVLQEQFKQESGV